MIEIQFDERQDNMRHGLRQFYDKKSKEELVELCVDLYISRHNIMNEYNSLIDEYNGLLYGYKDLLRKEENND